MKFTNVVICFLLFVLCEFIHENDNLVGKIMLCEIY